MECQTAENSGPEEKDRVWNRGERDGVWKMREFAWRGMGYRKWGNLCGGDGLRNKGKLTWRRMWCGKWG